MKTKVIASSLLIAVLATGCENPKQAIGTLGGGALGAWAGSTIGKGTGNVVATAVGAVGGALLGGYIGGQLDQKDRMMAERTAQTAFESTRTGQAARWVNPDTGNSGVLIPTRTFQSQGQQCREYTQTIMVGGKRQEGYGTACRQPDGSWLVQQ